jgi:dihydropteroate synthase
MTQLATQIKKIDDKLSKRPIKLDPGGYFIIYIDREDQLIYAKHYTNLINAKGLAVDPDTGEVIAARGKKVKQRTAETIFSARTAKELCVKVIEEPNPSLITMFDHAAYLGREFTRAEYALVTGQEYIQD